MLTRLRGIFGRPIAYKYLIDNSRRPDGTFLPGYGPNDVSGLSGKFVRADYALSQPGDYIYLSPDFGRFGLPGYKVGPAPVTRGVFGLGAAGGNAMLGDSTLCASNCAVFKGSGRRSRCTNICVAAVLAGKSDCSDACDREFEASGRKAKCSAACSAAARGESYGSDALLPDVGGGGLGAALPIIAVIGALAVGVMLLKKKKKKKGK